MYDLKKIGRQLKEERIKQNISIKQLSLLSGVRYVEIYRYEEGIREINIESLIKITFVLQIKTSDLFPYNQSYDYACEQFEYLVKNLNIKSIHFILNIVAAIVENNKKNNKVVSNEMLRRARMDNKDKVSINPMHKVAN